MKRIEKSCTYIEKSRPFGQEFRDVLIEEFRNRPGGRSRIIDCKHVKTRNYPGLNIENSPL
jgi:hypothetical protein